MLKKYILNQKIIKQRIAEIPKNLNLYDFIINNSNFEEDVIFTIISLEKNIFKFNLFASLILEEVENPRFEFKDFLKKLSDFFSIESEILRNDCLEFLNDMENQTIIIKNDLKCC